MGDDEQHIREGDDDPSPAPEQDSLRRSPTVGLYIFLAVAGTIILIFSGHTEWIASPWVVYVILRVLFPVQKVPEPFFYDPKKNAAESRRNFIILGIALALIAFLLYSILR